MQFASSFRYGSPILRADSPLSDDQIRRVAPSIFADGKHESRSERYTYIPTIDVLRGLRNEGFQPFMVCQTRVRHDDRLEYTKHMRRLRHADQITGDEANEIILPNSHDGTSSYQMLAGVLRFVCQNGMVAGDNVSDIRVPHKGNIVQNVINGAFDVFDDFDLIREQKEGMHAVTLEGTNSMRSPAQHSRCATIRPTHRHRPLSPTASCSRRVASRIAATTFGPSLTVCRKTSPREACTDVRAQAVPCPHAPLPASTRT
ncbi:protein of unknown function [Burkholderia sp. GAS332]|nr:protein of unknown function [Burkholderia sp. GAS332]